MAKGGAYEREICKLLSKWWTNGKRDDIFWRTSNSGGRATTRRKQGKSTKGQDSDITNTDPCGAALIDLFMIEVKRGYSKHTLADTLDRGPKLGQTMWEQWHQQVSESWQRSGSFSWLLITRRDSRQPFVFMPITIYNQLDNLVKFPELVPAVMFASHFRHKRKPGNHQVTRLFTETIMGMSLKLFLKNVSRNHIEYLSSRL